MRRGLAAAGVALALAFGLASDALADTAVKEPVAQGVQQEGLEEDDSGKLGLLGLIGLAGLAGLFRRPESGRTDYRYGPGYGGGGQAGYGGGGYGGGPGDTR